MIENRVAPVGEAVVRFLSFFTILTNTLVAKYFTLAWWVERSGGTSNQDSNSTQIGSVFGKFSRVVKKPGTLTAVTMYITIVGLVYQIILRGIWEQTGLHRVRRIAAFSNSTFSHFILEGV